MEENGDPRFRETRDWVNSNTKQCPSCGVNVQKGPGCFHMTCESTYQHSHLIRSDYNNRYAMPP